MIFRKAIASIIVISGISLAGPVDAASVDLDFTSAFRINKGRTYSPDPNVTITARGNIDPADDLNPVAAGLQSNSNQNTIVLSRGGMGVQEPNGHSGSTGISGRGHEENEEVIFDFGLSIWASSAVLGLGRYTNGTMSSTHHGGHGSRHGAGRADAPYLYLFVDRLNDYLVFDPEDIAAEFSYAPGSRRKGTLAFGDLISRLDVFGQALLSDDLISSFKLRNSRGEMTITSFSGDDLTAIPLPAALPLYGTGLAVMGLVGWRKRRKAAALA